MISLRDINIELARREFWEYCKLREPDFYKDSRPHLKKLCNTLDDFLCGRLLKDNGEPYTKVMIRMPPQHGKLLPIDTPVLTTTGWVNHGDLNNSHYVYGQDGKPKRVIANSGAYKWPVRTIEFNDGNKLKASPEHLWRIKADYDDKKGRVEKELQTKDIFARRNRRSPYIDISPALQNEDKELLIDPYTLGCWLGDGDSRDPYLTCHVDDAEHFSSLGDIMDINNRPTIKRIRLNGLRPLLRHYNLIKNKHIPLDYLLASESQRLALFQGLMDTDGTCDKRGNCEFTQKESRLADDVQVLVRTLGIKSRVKTYKAKLYGRVVGNKQRVMFTANKDDVFFRLKRKQDKIVNKTTDDRNDKYKFFIKSISDDEEYVIGNCIEVEDSMYLAGRDLIPTHNSRSLVNLTQWALGKNNEERIITASYGDGQATDFSRYTRDGINEIANTQDQLVFSDIFPDTKIKQGNSSVQKWALEGQHFNYLGVGMGGGVTGKGATLRIIDDLVKDIEVAINDTALDKIWRWLSGTFSSRNASEGGEVKEIFCATLWSENDPQAKLEQTEGDEWYILSMPIYDEESGEMLCDEMMNYKSFQKLKKRMLVDSTSKLVFYANYMCQALADEENSIYTESSLNKYIDLPVDNNGNIDGWMLAAIDPADDGNDYYAAPFGLVSGNDVYIVDAIFNQNNIDLNLPELEAANKKYKFADIYIETNNVGAKHARDIKRKILSSAYGAWSSTNKMGRILTQAQTIKTHFFFPENPSPALRRFMTSMVRLKKTSTKDDDAADAISMMSNYLNTRYGLFKD